MTLGEVTETLEALVFLIWKMGTMPPVLQGGDMRYRKHLNSGGNVIRHYWYLLKSLHQLSDVTSLTESSQKGNEAYRNILYIS